MAEEDFLQSICIPITDDTRLRELREDVSRMCRNDCPSFFPGSQPVSMDRENVKYLSKLKYCVCEKTDGVRYMLLIWKNRFYFIDRKFEFHVLKDVDLGAAGSFLESLPYLDHINLNKATVLDGELLLETKAEKP
ncbi:hypothetical protein WA588_005634 [Blastocystis sp. NMH]